MSDGGYDEGYSACPCFWGTLPAEMVVAAISALGNKPDRRALDLGCGEGKNSNALAQANFDVIAVDVSEVAVGNAMKAFSAARIHWLVADLQSIRGPKDHFDIVIATGSLHCLPKESDVLRTIDIMKSVTKRGGLNVVYSFNDGPHDMRGHSVDFVPTLLSHESYLKSYADWEVLKATDIVQTDQHPHNRVEHSHSITRLMARRP